MESQNKKKIVSYISMLEQHGLHFACQKYFAIVKFTTYTCLNKEYSSLTSLVKFLWEKLFICSY